MKRKSFIISAVILTLIVTTGTLMNRGAHAVSVIINVKDLPEHGLKIIGPSDPSFDPMFAGATKNESATVVGAIKPYSFFLRNAGSRHVIAYKFRWECVKPDGTIVYKDSSVSSAWIFTDEMGGNLKKALSRDDSIIKPNSTWMFSLGLAPRQLDDSPSSLKQRGDFAVVATRVGQEQIGVLDETQALRLLHEELARYTSITIVLDGVFFEDGAFEGPDATGFFGAVKSEIDARLDILTRFKQGVQQGKSSDEIFQVLDDISKEEDPDIGPDSTASDYYRFHKKIFAQELLSQKQFLGSDQAIKHNLKRLEMPWATLRKR